MAHKSTANAGEGDDLGGVTFARSVQRQKDLERFQHAQGLAAEGMKKNLIMTLTGVTGTIASRLLTVAGFTSKSGRSRDELTKIYLKPARHLEASMFVQVFGVIAPQLQSDTHSVGAASLLRSWAVFKTLNPQKELNINVGFLLARDLGARKVELVRCRIDNCEYLRPIDPVMVRGEAHQVGCPWCRVRSNRVYSGSQRRADDDD